ncbi:hypothetical protein J5837_16230 [Pseudoxanthomonas helianthi]|uniref:Uncharacterized protein n=1 Tax=Pseudoxanthomonas helianthi TaxID=1453541 RepID=A0A940X5Y8_9GAMM|nr:hypothetical protein [Pseudoxanthomonas helianthi]MBP3985955.1 hypothetical protein [Pseudoxanthomonas helianthi]
MKIERKGPTAGGRAAAPPQRSGARKPQPQNQNQRKPVVPGPNKAGRDQDRDGVVGSENDDPGR